MAKPPSRYRSGIEVLLGSPRPRNRGILPLANFLKMPLVVEE